MLMFVTAAVNVAGRVCFCRNAAILEAAWWSQPAGRSLPRGLGADAPSYNAVADSSAAGGNSYEGLCTTLHVHVGASLRIFITNLLFSSL